MRPQVNIVGVVDVIGALSDQTLLKGNLCMMDDGAWESTGRGTSALSTVCRPGQIVQWVVHAVDVQTPVQIRNITFLGSDQSTIVPGHDDARAAGGGGSTVWSGVFPPYAVPGMEYRYRLELQMYEGKNSVLSIDSCSLKCLKPCRATEKAVP